MSTSLMPATSEVNTEEIPWAEWAMDWGVVGVKLLRVCEATGSYTAMTRMPAGMVVPRHRHLAAVHGYTLAGRWRYLEYDWVATVGSYIHEPPGSVHTLCVEEDMVGLFVIEGPQLTLGPDGEILEYVDYGTVRERYRAALAKAGEAYPTAILG